jgi:hypothetical protein
MNMLAGSVYSMIFRGLYAPTPRGQAKITAQPSISGSPYNFAILWWGYDLGSGFRYAPPE